MGAEKTKVFAKIRAGLILANFIVTVPFIIVLMYLFKKNPVISHKIRAGWSKLQMKILGIKVESQGAQDLDADMVLMNHQSLLDIMIMESLHNKNLAWVAKKEIADMFFYGHILKAPDMIIIDRENRTGIVTLLKESSDRLEKGRPIAIFPEGTRSDGCRLLDFRPGAKLIAERVNAYVQPVVFIGTRHIMDSLDFTHNPGTVKVIYLDAIEAKKGTDWYDQVWQAMEKTLQEYTGETWAGCEAA